mgnify:CR=1 FL=1
MEQPGNTSTSSVVVPVITRDDYQIGLEFVENHFLFCHVAVSGPTTRRTLASLRADFDRLASLVGRPLFGLEPEAASEQPKFAKFAALMGFHPFQRVECASGPPRMVYTRRNEPWAA